LFTPQREGLAIREGVPVRRARLTLVLQAADSWNLAKQHRAPEMTTPLLKHDVLIASVHLKGSLLLKRAILHCAFANVHQKMHGHRKEIKSN
jgi:hypothetical protein